MAFNIICFGIYCFFFFFNDTATTEIYTLSLHDALPICMHCSRASITPFARWCAQEPLSIAVLMPDRKSTRLNSSHSQISYAVFCLKKKKKTESRLPATTLPLGGRDNTLVFAVCVRVLTN